MFDELTATLATLRANHGDEEDEPELINGRRVSTGVREALEFASLRRQNSTRDAEMLQAEKAGNARRERAAREAARSNELQSVFSYSRPSIGDHHAASPPKSLKQHTADSIDGGSPLQSELEKAFAERKKPLTLRNASPARPSRGESFGPIASTARARVDGSSAAPGSDGMTAASAGPTRREKPARDTLTTHASSAVLRIFALVQALRCLSAW